MKYAVKLYGQQYFQHFILALENRLKLPLPGEKAHLKMASKIRLKELQSIYNTSKAISSGVLILLYPEDNSIKTVLIERQKYDGVHSGQVSFPGRRQEEGDKSLIETALRESNEEVNTNPANVEIIGTLTELYIPPSNFLVLPIIGYLKTKPNLIPEKNEVAEIITADISFLFEKKLKKEKTINVRGYKIKAPYYDVQGHIVWGATAMILSELAEVIESIS